MTTHHFDPFELVRATAAAVLTVHAQHGTGLDVPYPPAAQVALDRMTAACLLAGHDAPASVPALMALCRTHLSKWPISVPLDYAGPDAVFIDEPAGLPTHTCVEWAFSTSCSSSHTDVSNPLRGLAGDCPSAAIYGRCRDFLIDNAVVNKENSRAILALPGGEAVWKRVRHLYGKFPDACAYDGRGVRCPACGCPAIVVPEKSSRCESGFCPDFTPRAGEPVSELCALPRELRHSLSAPGRVEREVRKTCVAAGGHVELVPDLIDHFRVCWPSGDVWRVVIRTDSEPALLAQHIRSWAPLDAARVVVAVPGHVIDRRPGYREVFDRHRGLGCPELVPAELVASQGRDRTDDGGERRA